MLRAKEGVMFKLLTPEGLHILNALTEVSGALGIDLTITSACDGMHSGPDDPHHKGNAYDVRSKDIEDKEAVLTKIMEALGDNPQPSSGGYVTAKYFGWLEAAGTDNEHYHFQLRHT
jgi:hypothetical protein